MKCQTPYCHHNALPQRRYCPTCKTRMYREKHPIRASYHNLRSNAKRRGKIFTITLEYFGRFAVETEYIKKKGRSQLSYSVDCIVEELGYVPGNIRSLPNRDNAIKGNEYKKKLRYQWIEEMRRMEFKVETIRPQEHDGQSF